MRKIYEKRSFFSKIINRLFKYTDAKKIYSSEEEIKKYIEIIFKKSYDIPKKLGLNLEKYEDMEVYTYNGTIDNSKNKFLLYIHGGSYIEEAISLQIKFAMKIAKKTNSTLIFPRYPLAPKGNYKTMYEKMYPLYKLIESKNQKINFLGDSAGGGFVLSFSMLLRERIENQPQNIIMMSPWLDLSLENPDLLESEKLDNMSGIIGNKYTGKLWANDLDIKNYLVSPLYGEFNDLPKMTIITGGYDFLKPDCLLLDKKLIDKNIDHNYIEYKGQGHDFGAYPIKEGNLVIEDIVNIINEN